VESIGLKEPPSEIRRFYWKNYLPKPRVGNDEATKPDFADKDAGMGRNAPGDLQMPKIKIA